MRVLFVAVFVENCGSKTADDFKVPSSLQFVCKFTLKWVFLWKLWNFTGIAYWNLFIVMTLIVYFSYP